MTKFDRINTCVGIILTTLSLLVAFYFGYVNAGLQKKLLTYEQAGKIYMAKLSGDSLVLQSVGDKTAMPTDLTVTPLFSNETGELSQGRTVHIPITKSDITDFGRIVTLPRVLKIICNPKLDKGSDCETIRNLEVRFKINGTADMDVLSL